MRTRTLFLSLGTLATLAGAWSAATASAPAVNQAARYEITVTNVTRGQILGPVMASAHSSAVTLFELGEPVSAELAHLAEEGDPSMLINSLTLDPNVLIARTNGAPTMPGDDAVVQIVVDDNNPYISLASMLVSTNDAFIALRNIPAPASEATYLARVYDAGSEFNSEDCAYVPGPPCGSGGSHDPTPAEGFVRIHEGVHGIASLAAEAYDWRGEAAQVRIRRLNP